MRCLFHSICVQNVVIFMPGAANPNRETNSFPRFLAIEQPGLVTSVMTLKWGSSNPDGRTVIDSDNHIIIRRDGHHCDGHQTGTTITTITTITTVHNKHHRNSHHCDHHHYNGSLQWSFTTTAIDCNNELSTATSTVRPTCSYINGALAP